MTAQVRDSIHFEGRDFALASEPLGTWLARRRNRDLRFRRPHTACSRGYVASWAVARGRLYLTGFTATWPDGREATVEELFDRYPPSYYASTHALDPAHAGPGHFAFWFSETVCCPFGRLLRYEHVAYGGIRERDLFLRFHDGFLVGSSIRENTLPPIDPFEAELEDLDLDV
ncbi:hypothetical protein [Aquabacterium sp.]|uniref:hypothetical protein n=1 Tax=Aquabacterium sp. TaxID=1872578 RepID=UPI0037842E3A